MACAICTLRRPRRFCPGVRGDICTICCGTEREVTVACPLDCEFLQESRKHDKPAPIDPEQVPNRDIRVSEKLLEQNETLLAFLGGAVAKAALDTAGAADRDVREALEGLIRTYRSLESGVYYDSVPSNLLAAGIYRAVERDTGEFRRQERENTGVTKTRDADVLGCLVFLQRLEFDRNNGRPRGRAFLSALFEFYGGSPSASPPAASSLILP